MRITLLALLAAALAAPAHADPLAEILAHPGRDLWDGGYDVSVSAPSRAASPAAPNQGRNVGKVATTVPILSQRTVRGTAAAIMDYRAIVAAGGWPVVPATAKLRLGASGPAVAALRRRLMISGDLSTAAGASDQYDTWVEQAVRRFQTRHGLRADGVLGPHSLSALNVSAAVRLRQLEINLARLQKHRASLRDRRYVMVNIPGAEIEAVENGRVAQRHTAVVGRISRPTPILSSRITELNLNPYWHAPASIVRRDIIPLMRKDPGYLARNGIRIFTADKRELDPRTVNWATDEATKYHFKQDPSRRNAMRAAKINFPNKHAVYMHDTPEQGLFDNLVRFESSGCVRVRNIRDLLAWLAKETPGWNRRSLQRTIAAGERTDAKLQEPVGVHFMYFTAWSSERGAVHFRDDVYKHDAEAAFIMGG